jgi:tRNA threonylcarbamoyladenosine biosynthesis protein TsaB
MLAPAADALLKLVGKAPTQLDAIAISSGPGSYTGLRIGASLAKGLCFGADLPLIAISTLQAMAVQVQTALQELGMHQPYYLAPMIDARRMEVYTAAYNHNLHQLISPHAFVLQTLPIFSRLEPEVPMYYFGSGAAKFVPILNANPSYHHIAGIHPRATEVGILANKAYAEGNFADASTYEPEYLKAFGQITAAG